MTLLEFRYTNNNISWTFLGFIIIVLISPKTIQKQLRTELRDVGSIPAAGQKFACKYLLCLYFLITTTQINQCEVTMSVSDGCYLFRIGISRV